MGQGEVGFYEGWSGTRQGNALEEQGLAAMVRPRHNCPYVFLSKVYNFLNSNIQYVEVSRKQKVSYKMSKVTSILQNNF